jgi:hypothetical protein
MARSDPTIFGRYDRGAVCRLLAVAGVFDRLEERGFSEFDLRIETEGRALPRVSLFAEKAGRRHLLIEACLGEATVRPDFFRRRGVEVETPFELALVYWLREEDPTRSFSSDRPALPAQHHPGLGCLRRAFRAIVTIGADLGKDGVASVPKFFHDAVLFHHSRLFLFLDGNEQGRFEALLRDLANIPIGETSIALLEGRVRNGGGRPAGWMPGFQVFPLSERARDYLNSGAYADAVGFGLAENRFELFDTDRLPEATPAPRPAAEPVAAPPETADD